MLPDVLKVRTSDNVSIGYVAAGIPSRFMAFLIDGLINLAILVVAAVAGSALYSALGSSGGLAEALGLTVFSLVLVLGHFLYFAILEATSAGRTPGKRAVGLRVVRIDGSAPGLGESLVRNIARLVDYTLGIGLFVAFFHPQSRRVGDLLAGTVVIRERTAATHAPVVMSPVLLRAPDAGPAIDGLDRLGEHEQGILRAFLSRPGLPAEQRARIAHDMSVKLFDRLQLAPSAPERIWPPELFVERLYLQLSARLGHG
ncbi:MAG TPA: RDD family protein [Candidatus Dormibacteraeota bacterium]|nr:RDD family protein [Candidatus Dormibacteraeota bacterium]